MKRVPEWLFYAVCGVLAAAGLFFTFALSGHDFLGLVCFCLLLLLAGFRGLRWLGKKHPKGARVLRTGLAVCTCAGVLVVAVTGGIIAGACAGEPDGEYAYIVVLGAGVNGRTPSLSLRNRLDAAYAYLEAHPQAVCVASGCQGSGEDISEAACMYDYLTEKGIAPERIWQEDRARNTRENLAFSLDLIEARTGSRPEEIGLVSSEYHLYRAGLFAAAQGVRAHGIPGRTTWPTLFLNYFLREIAAVWYSIILGS